MVVIDKPFPFVVFFYYDESVLEGIACTYFPSSLDKTYSNLDGFLWVDVSVISVKNSMFIKG